MLKSSSKVDKKASIEEIFALFGAPFAHLDPFFEGTRVGDLGRSEWWVGRGRNGRTLGSKSRSVAGVTVAQWKPRVATP